MWPKIAAASALLLLIQGSAFAQDCTYTVSVLDVPGVQCVSAAPCSGTYYASGLSQGVGACPSGSSCALLPQTPIMGCAATGRTDLVYVNADGTLTKDGKTVSLADATTTTTTTATTSSPSSTTTPTTSNTGSKSNNSQSTGNTNGSKSTGNDSNASSGSNAKSNADGGSDASSTGKNSTVSSHSNSHSHSNSRSSSSASHSWSSSDSTSGTIVSPGSSSANQQSFNPGSILSDNSDVIGKASTGGVSLGAVIGIVVGCLAVVAIAAGARLLQKGKEAEAEGELTTPQGAAMEGYNGGEGGGSGMTPKENVLLL
ncbi:Mitogen-activated protein kinase kinase kinase 2 [Phytophthora cinnamomi]|uniref:Mitogen-activated protein kinase kinase kinase 2 n=1 Tax=Phytophthora cinnamomi TaxID=4785 RepID=UPI00355A3D07|nr:Mitogen-activated protein kinase kinase kinase 2 [Phytophthora cinnamomi]